MKKITPLALLAIAILSLSSCVSSKKLIYFQGSDTLFAEPQVILQRYEMHLKPADQVLIKVTCDNPELLEIFNLDVVIGSGNRGGGSSNYISGGGGGSTMGNIYGYMLDSEGFIDLPVLGKIQVMDMTVEEAARAIERTIIEKDLIKEPKVTVRLLNARVTVIGASGPTVVNLTSERNTILDVLAQAGDVKDWGLRRKISLYRETDGKRCLYHIDLTRADVFNHPCFYMQQNDLIYVKPNKTLNVRASALSAYTGMIGGVLGFLSSIVAFAALLTK